MPWEQLSSKTVWKCEGDGLFNGSYSDLIREALYGPLYLRIEDYLSVNVTNKMDECLNADGEERFIREKIVLD